MNKTALIVVDVQNDFCPGGSLAVAGGDQLGKQIAKAAVKADLLVATMDWHPARHCSFVEQGGIWPPHCVQGSPGAELHWSVAAMDFDFIQRKGMLDREQYSGFDHTDLADWLRKRGVDQLIICGIATDYCVLATAVDAVKEGFAVTVLRDACAAVSDADEAFAKIAKSGATVR